MTGTSTSVADLPFSSATKVLERMMSSVVTPNSLFLSYTPAFFQYFGGDSHGGIHRVGDNADAGLRAGFGNLLHEVLHDTRIHIKQVGTIHAGLTRHARGDQHYIRAFQRRSSVFTGKSFNFFTSVGI